jgi:hypothetical protein
MKFRAAESHGDVCRDIIIEVIDGFAGQIVPPFASHSTQHARLKIVVSMLIGSINSHARIRDFLFAQPFGFSRESDNGLHSLEPKLRTIGANLWAHLRERGYMTTESRTRPR